MSETFSRRDFLKMVGATAVGSVVGLDKSESGAVEFKREKKEINPEDFSDNVLEKEIERIASTKSPEQRIKLLNDYKIILHKMDESVYKSRLYGEGQNKKYFSAMIQKWDKIFPIIIEACKDEDSQRDMDLEGALIEILCGETALRPGKIHKGKKNGAGPYQIESETARAWGLTVDTKTDQRWDFGASTRAVAKYLRRAHSRYGQWGLSMMAFGKGDGAVKKIIKKHFGIDIDKEKRNATAPNYLPQLLLSKGVNIVSVYNKSKKGRHTFIKEALSRRFKNIIFHSKISQN